MLPLLSLLAAPAHAEWPPGAEIEPAATVDITAAGFESIEQIVPALLPSLLGTSGLVIPDVQDAQEECTDIIITEVCWYSYEYKVSNIQVNLAIDNVQIAPVPDAIDVSATAVVSINNPANPINLFAGGDVLGFIGSSTTCTISADRDILVDISTKARLNRLVGQAGPYLDVQIDPITWTWNFADVNFPISCDGTIGDILGAVEDILDFFGFSIEELIEPIAADLINQQIAPLRDDLNATLRESLQSLDLSQVLDLNGVSLNLDIAPSDVHIDTDGMRLGAMGSAWVDQPADCILDYDVPGSLQTPSDLSPLGQSPLGTPYHIGVLASDDFINQVLFAAWQGGLLCYEVTDDLGLPIDTSLLGLLAPGVFDEYFPDTESLQIKVRPEKPPIAVTTGTHDVEIDVDDLGLDLFAPVDGRVTRIAGIGLSATVGADLSFDGNTGALAVGIDFGADDLMAAVDYNELAPEGNAAIESGFAGLFDSIAGPLISGLTGGLSFALPGIEGLGLTSLELTAAGPSRDFLGGFGTIGQVPYSASGTGCSCDGGEASSCDTGCGVSGTVPSRGLPIVAVAAIAALRRRARRS